MQPAASIETLVREAYSAVAEDPAGRHPFPVGRAFAESLGYPAPLLDRLPPASVAVFTGVSRVAPLADLAEGSVVLDVGCGAGLDALLAAGKVGPAGTVLAMDSSDAMLKRARAAARETGASNVAIHGADARELPLESGSVDAAMINGLLNLNPGRERILSELVRVLKPGGSLWLAELILKTPGAGDSTFDADSWFA